MNFFRFIFTICLVLFSGVFSNSLDYSNTGINLFESEKNLNDSLRNKPESQIAIAEAAIFKRSMIIARGTEVDPAVRLARGTEVDPAVRLARGTEVDPAVRLARGTEVDPAVRLARGTEVDPTARLARGTEVDPTARLARGTEVDPRIWVEKKRV